MTEKLNVNFKRLNGAAVAPKYAHDGDAGFDLVATEDVVIEPGETALVKTGLAVELPQGYEMQIRPRSGITLKTKLRVNLGTLDAGYRGEIGVIVDNTNRVDCFDDGLIEYSPSDIAEEVASDSGHYTYGTYIIRKGDRIAQAVIQRLPAVQFAEVAELGESTRGQGGFGSTGVSNAKEAE